MSFRRPRSFVLLLSAVVFGLLCSACCVVEGTRIATPSGEVLIEDLRVGDAVISLSERGEQVISRVTAKRGATAISYLEISTDGADGPLKVTSAHPVMTADGWREARRLRVEDPVETRSGMQPLLAVEKRWRIARVYDITVEPHANFFADGVLVHNKSVAAPPAEVEDLPGVYTGPRGRDGDPMFRLDLRDDHTGYLAWFAESQEPQMRLYRITRWNSVQGQVTCALHQIVPGHPDLPLEILDGRGYGRRDSASLWLKFRQRLPSGEHEEYWIDAGREGKFLYTYQRSATDLARQLDRSYQLQLWMDQHLPEKKEDSP